MNTTEGLSLSCSLRFIHVAVEGSSGGERTVRALQGLSEVLGVKGDRHWEEPTAESRAAQ